MGITEDCDKGVGGRWRDGRPREPALSEVEGFKRSPPERNFDSGSFWVHGFCLAVSAKKSMAALSRRGTQSYSIAPPELESSLTHSSLLYSPVNASPQAPNVYLRSYSRPWTSFAYCASSSPPPETSSPSAKSFPE